MPWPAAARAPPLASLLGPASSHGSIAKGRRVILRVAPSMAQPTQRGQSAAALKEVNAVLQLEQSGGHFTEKDGGPLTPAESRTRAMWAALTSVATVPTFGSLQLTVRRAKIRFRMGSYKHMEKQDHEAIEHYEAAREQLTGVLSAQGLDDEGKTTQAEARTLLGQVDIECGMALQDTNQYSKAIERYQAAVRMGVANRRHRWVCAGGRPDNYGISQCEAALAGAAPASASGRTDEVAVVGETTREQRDAEGRKRAIVVDDMPTRKIQAVHLGERVATARSTTDAAITRRMKEIIQPVIDEWLDGKVEATELKRRKEAAKAQATTEHVDRSSLDDAFEAYTAAVKAREAAEEQEAAAEQAVQKALEPFEGSSSGA